jgi:hypothetical protein
MPKVLIEAHYLPCIAYFAVIQRFNEVCLEKYEHFVKQSFRNRCYINTEHGRDVLIVPLTSKHGKVPIKDVRIDNSQKWVNNHWRSICSAYGKAPFFEFYAEDLEKILFGEPTFLYDLNYELLTMCLKWLKSSVTVKETLSYEKNILDGKNDLRSRIDVKDEESINLVYTKKGYQQVFGNAFVANLSIIDLVFCCGPEAGSIITASFRANEQIPF